MKQERKAAYLEQWRAAQRLWLLEHGFRDQKHGHWARDGILVEVYDESCCARAAGASGADVTAKAALHRLRDLLIQHARVAKDGASRVLDALHGT